MVSEDKTVEPVKKFRKRYDFLTFGECSREFLRSTTFHGFRRAGWTRSGVVKLLWIIFWLIGMTAFVCMMVFMVLRYLDYPKVTRVKSELGFYSFPGITVCNTNPVKKSNIEGILDPLYEFEKNANFTWNHTDMVIDPYEKNFNDFSKIMAMKEYDERVSLGHTLRDLVKYCAYDGRACDMEKDFSTAVWNDRYGACYTFGGSKPPEDNVDTVDAKFKASNQKTITGPGWQHGLVMVLDTQSYEHINRLTEERGVRVAIHSAATMPFPDESGISIPTGTEATINLHLVEEFLWVIFEFLALQEHVSRVTIPEGVCRDYTSKNRYKFLYSQAACNKICKQEKVWEHCLCVSPNHQVDPSAKTCSLNDIYSQQYRCYHQVMDMFASGQEKCDCPPSCEEDRYKYDYSLAKWPAGDRNYMMPYCQELVPLQINYNTDVSWKKTKCQQILNNFYCGCRDDGLSVTDLNLYPEMKQWPICDVNKPNIKYCRDQVENSLKENTLSCSCSTERRYIRNVLDLLTLHSIGWNETGRSSLAISRRPDDFVSLKVYTGVVGRTVYTEYSTYTFVNMLTEIGGVSALFIGASFLTCIEVLEYFITMLLIPCINFPPWLDEEEKQRRRKQAQNELNLEQLRQLRPGTSVTATDVQPDLEDVNARRLPHKFDDDDRKPITAT